MATLHLNSKLKNWFRISFGMWMDFLSLNSKRQSLSDHYPEPGDQASISSQPTIWLELFISLWLAISMHCLHVRQSALMHLVMLTIIVITMKRLSSLVTLTICVTIFKLYYYYLRYIIRMYVNIYIHTHTYVHTHIYECYM